MFRYCQVNLPSSGTEGKPDFPLKVRPICFCDRYHLNPSTYADGFPNISRANVVRSLTALQQKEIASGRKFNSERFAARAPRFTTSVKRKRLSAAFRGKG